MSSTSPSASGAPPPVPSPPPAVRGLFGQRVPGDGALLALAGLRFAQAGMPAEIYAESPADADRILRHVPAHEALPMVHLGRSVNLLEPGGRATVAAFLPLGDRVAGVVVHDQRGMRARVPEVLDALRRLGDRGDGPRVFLEYAAGAPLEWFADVGRRSAGIERAGVCLDTGHVGLVEVRRRLRESMPPGAGLEATDPGLEAVVGQVQEAVDGALPAVLGLIDDLGAAGSAVHLHLHDGHPCLPGLSDHLSFFLRVPVPFVVGGARSLPPLYGPAGLAAILHRAVEAVAPDRLSLTLEIHQAEGRLPLDPSAAALFAHWTDRTNAERLNYLLSVIAANHVLATTVLERSWR